MTLRNTCRVAIVLLAVGYCGPRAQAIEMFTNFNNGMEFNTRPLGIDQLPPVRYHWWQPAPGQPLFFGHRCRDCQGAEDSEFQPDAPESVSAPSAQPAADEPIQLRAEPSDDSQNDAAEDSADHDSSRQELRRPVHDWRSGGDSRRDENYMPRDR